LAHLKSLKGFTIAFKGLSGSPHIYLNRSTGLNGWYGETIWTDENRAIQSVQGNINTSTSPAVTSYNNSLVMAWKGMEGDQQIWHSYSSWNPSANDVPDARNWTAPVVVRGATTTTATGAAAGAVANTSTTPSLVQFSPLPLVGWGRGLLVMAWKGVEGDERIWYSYTYSPPAKGGRWTDPVVVPGAMTTTSPALASFNNLLVMAWKGVEDRRIWYSYTSDPTNVSKWAVPAPVLFQPNKAFAETTTSPALASFNNLLFMAWNLEGLGEIWWNYTSDPTDVTNWRITSDVIVPTMGYGPSSGVTPALGVFGGNVGRLVFAWTSDDHQIWYCTTSDPFNEQFTFPKKVPGAATETFPSLSEW
jgi:hypothetical protein